LNKVLKPVGEVLLLKEQLKVRPGRSASSSLGATTSIVECFELLNIKFTIIAILDEASPILYFQFLPVVSYVILPSIFWSY